MLSDTASKGSKEDDLKVLGISKHTNSCLAHAKNKNYIAVACSQRGKT